MLIKNIGLFFLNDILHLCLLMGKSPTGHDFAFLEIWILNQIIQKIVAEYLYVLIHWMWKKEHRSKLLIQVESIFFYDYNT